MTGLLSEGLRPAAGGADRRHRAAHARRRRRPDAVRRRRLRGRATAAPRARTAASTPTTSSSPTAAATSSATRTRSSRSPAPGITVPGRGFLLNNELTDFNFATGTANSVAPNKRPRSSMSPTIVTAQRPGDRGGRLAGRLDDHHHRAADAAQPDRLRDEAARGDRGAAREPAQRQRDRRRARVHRPVRRGPGRRAARPSRPAAPARRAGRSTSASWPALKFLPGGRVQTATESWRGGGGSAMVVRPENPR